MNCPNCGSRVVKVVDGIRTIYTTKLAEKPDGSRVAVCPGRKCKQEVELPPQAA